MPDLFDTLSPATIQERFEEFHRAHPEVFVGAEFKLNDHLHSRYVRMIVDEYPEEFDGYFELRSLKAV